MQRIVGAVSVHMKAGAPAKTHSCYRHHLSQTSASNAFLVIQTGVGLAYFNVVVTCQGKEEAPQLMKKAMGGTYMTEGRIATLPGEEGDVGGQRYISQAMFKR